MDDMERYGDYNEVDEPKKGKGNIFVLIVKILIGFVCVAVIGILGFRMVLFSHYPDSAKKLYWNDRLIEHYEQNGGDIKVQTQDIRFPYDDAEEGNFFSDYVYVIRDAGQLQVALRYNSAIFKNIEDKYGVTIDPDREDIFTFRVARDPRENDTEDGSNSGDEVIAEPVGTLSYVHSEMMLMYTYYKLVFDDIDFGSEDEPSIEWLRVEVFINGVEMDEPYMILVYENNDAYSSFDDYNVSNSEVPAK